MPFNTDTNPISRGSIFSLTSTSNSNSTDDTSLKMLRSSSSTKFNQTKNTGARSYINSRQQSFIRTNTSKFAKTTPSLENEETDESEVQPFHIEDSSTSLSDQQQQNSDSSSTISATSLSTVKTNNTNGTNYQRSQPNSGEISPICQQHQQRSTAECTTVYSDMTQQTGTSPSTPRTVYECSYDTKSSRHSNHGPVYQQYQRQSPVIAPLSYLNMLRKRAALALASSTLYGPSNSIRRDGPILNIPDSPNQHHNRRPLISMEAQQSPISLTRRRSLADISSRSNSTSSTSSSSSSLPLFLHSEQQQQTQPRLRHPSRLDSAGFMRPSKCAACNPDPPAKPSILTPPVGVGVPLFGPPPDSIPSPLPKASLGRRSSPSSRGGGFYDRSNKHDQPSDLSSSSSAIGVEGNKRKGNKAMAHKDRPAPMNQHRRSATTNLAIQKDQDRRRRLSSPKPLQHDNSTTAKGYDGGKRSLHDRHSIYDWPRSNNKASNYDSTDYDSPSLFDKPSSDESTTGYDRPSFFDKPTSNNGTNCYDRPSLFDKPSSYDRPSLFDKPTSYDKTENYDRTSYDRPSFFDKSSSNDTTTSYDRPSSNNSTSSDRSSLFDKRTCYDSATSYDKPSFFDKPSSNDRTRSYDSTKSFDKPSIYDSYTYHSQASNSPNRRKALGPTQAAPAPGSKPVHALERQSSSPRLDLNNGSARSSPLTARSNDHSPSAPLATSVPDIETTTSNLKKLLSKLLRPEYATLLDDTQDLLEKDATHPHPLSLPAVMNDIIQRGGLVQGHLLDLEQQLQALLDISQSSIIADTSNTNNGSQQQVTSGLSSTTLVVEEDSNLSMGKQCASLPLSISDLDVASTGTKLLHHDHVEQRQQISPKADREQWTAKLRLTLSRWLTDLNHGYLKNYETALDGSITTMTFTGYVATVEPSLLSQLVDTHKSESSPTALNKLPIQYQYTLSLSPEERRRSFGLSSSDLWISDEQVECCQFQNKSIQCQCKFNWVNRRHHCRRCGNIFCNTHSSNRLPLFTKEKSNQVKWSRVCDSCCYHMVGPYLVAT